MYNSGQNVWDTLCLGAEDAIQIDPPPHLDSVGCYKSNTFYISCTR